MRSNELSRRSLLKTVAITTVGLSGCLSGDDESPTARSTTPASDGTTAAGSDVSDGSASVASLSVSDFVLYPLAGTHPHVHRRANTQYVVVRLDSSFPRDTLRGRVALEVDGEPVSLAERQPVPWQHDTIDLAFAVKKGDTFESGRVLFDSTELDTLSTSALDRLNNPPVFEVGEPSVSPGELQAGAQVEATVTFRVTNTGEGDGEFGASLKGNYVSGANTLTATLAAGAERDVTGVTEIIGNGDAARVRLDWGSDEWATTIPVTGTPVESDTPTPTPAPK